MKAIQSFEISGIVPIIPTPFDEDQRIAWDELPALVGFAVGAGSCAICLPAYASEFYKLTEEERSELVSAAVRVSAGRVPVIGQANHPHAGAAAAMASNFCVAGAAAISVAVPRLFALPERDRPISVLRDYLRRMNRPPAVKKADFLNSQEDTASFCQ